MDAPADAAAPSGVQLAAVQVALDAGDMEALHAACADAPQALRNALRGLLHYHLGSNRLRTRQVVAEVRQLLDPAAQTP
jgi:DNA repair protein RecO (recombination protein O)